MDSQTADLLLGLAKAKAAAGHKGDRLDAWNSLIRAFDYYLGAADVEQVAAIAMYPFPMEVGVLATDAAQLITRALTLVPPDSHHAGHLQARRGNALGLLLGDYTGAQAAFDNCLATARRVGDATLEMGTLVSSAGVDWFHLHWQDAMEKSTKAIELGKPLDEPVQLWFAHLWAVNALTALGNKEEVRQLVRSIVPVAEALRHRSEVALANALNARVFHLSGDWESARDYGDRGLNLSPRHTQALVVRIMVEYESGDNGEGDKYLEQLVESVRSTAPGPNLPRAYLAQLVPMVSLIAGNSPGLEELDAARQAILASPYATPFATMLVRMGLGLTAVAQKDHELALEQYAALLSQRGTAFMMSGDRLLGLLARAMGRMDDASTHFEDALAFCRRAEYRPELAWSAFDYAETILTDAEGGPNARDGRQKATALLEEALVISQKVGMQPLMERVLSRRQILSA